MSELLDKLERARFLAVLRLRAVDPTAAELLDNALLFESAADGAFTVHSTRDSAGNRVDVEIGEISRADAELLGEEGLAKRLMALARMDELPHQ